MTFSAERLRSLRDKAGLTQEELADKVGMRRQAIYEYEVGKREPKSDTLLSISKALKTNASYLLSETSYSGPIDARAERALRLLQNDDPKGAFSELLDVLREVRDEGDNVSGSKP